MLVTLSFSAPFMDRVRLHKWSFVNLKRPRPSPATAILEASSTSLPTSGWHTRRLQIVFVLDLTHTNYWTFITCSQSQFMQNIRKKFWTTLFRQDPVEPETNVELESLQLQSVDGRCGTGLRRRRVVCGSPSSPSADAHCDSATKPPEVQPCRIQCPTTTTSTTPRPTAMRFEHKLYSKESYPKVSFHFFFIVDASKKAEFLICLSQMGCMTSELPDTFHRLVLTMILKAVTIRVNLIG